MWNQKLRYEKFRLLFRVASITIIWTSIMLSLTCNISLVGTLWNFSWMAIEPSFCNDSSNDNLSLLYVISYHLSWILRVIYALSFIRSLCIHVRGPSLSYDVKKHWQKIPRFTWLTFFHLSAICSFRT